MATRIGRTETPPKSGHYYVDNSTAPCWLPGPDEIARVAADLRKLAMSEMEGKEPPHKADRQPRYRVYADPRESACSWPSIYQEPELHDSDYWNQSY